MDSNKNNFLVDPIKFEAQLKLLVTNFTTSSLDHSCHTKVFSSNLKDLIVKYVSLLYILY